MKEDVGGQGRGLTGGPWPPIVLSFLILLLLSGEADYCRPGLRRWSSRPEAA